MVLCQVPDSGSSPSCGVQQEHASFRGQVQHSPDCHMILAVSGGGRNYLLHAIRERFSSCRENDAVLTSCSVLLDRRYHTSFMSPCLLFKTF